MSSPNEKSVASSPKNNQPSPPPEKSSLEVDPTIIEEEKIEDKYQLPQNKEQQNQVNFNDFDDESEVIPEEKKKNVETINKREKDEINYEKKYQERKKKDMWTRNTYGIQYYQNNINIYPPWEDKDKILINDDDKNLNIIFDDKFKEDEKNNDLFKFSDKEKDKGEKEDFPDTEFFFTLSFCYHVTKDNINTPIKYTPSSQIYFPFPSLLPLIQSPSYCIFPFE